MKPHVSVIIPTYNRAHILERAIDSVIQQTFKDIEVIIIDDGSTDQTNRLIRENYPTINYQQQTHSGVSAARNLGIQIANGELLALLDSDDSWQPTKLEQQLTALQQQPSMKICHTNEIWYRHGKRVNPMKKHQKYGGYIFEKCLDSCRISPSSLLIHRDIFKQFGLFDEHLPACEDYDLWLRLTAKLSVLYLEEPLTVKYGGHDDQLSQQYPAMDRFRITALQKMIDSGELSQTQQTAAINMLIKKTNIYLTGAKKRNKHDDIKKYQQLLEKHLSYAKA